MTFRFVVDCFEFTDVVVLKHVFIISHAHMIILFFLVQVRSVEKKKILSSSPVTDCPANALVMDFNPICRAVKMNLSIQIHQFA